MPTHRIPGAVPLSPRPFCTRCLKAARACLCHLVVPFTSGPRFVFLMHGKERRDRSGTGTGRLAHLCLSDSRLLVGLAFEAQSEVQALLDDPAAFPLVLYPGDNALDVSTLAGTHALKERCGLRRPTVFVLDGSWSAAPKILELNPRLAALPRVSFSTGRLSAYGFKRQPRVECLSSLEAVHELITLFEAGGLGASHPPGAHANLMRVFEALVTFQHAFSL